MLLPVYHITAITLYLPKSLTCLWKQLFRGKFLLQSQFVTPPRSWNCCRYLRHFTVEVTFNHNLYNVDFLTVTINNWHSELSEGYLGAATWSFVLFRGTKVSDSEMYKWTSGDNHWNRCVCECGGGGDRTAVGSDTLEKKSFRRTPVKSIFCVTLMMLPYQHFHILLNC